MLTSDSKMMSTIRNKLNLYNILSKMFYFFLEKSVASKIVLSAPHFKTSPNTQSTLCKCVPLRRIFSMENFSPVGSTLRRRVPSRVSGLYSI